MPSFSHLTRSRQIFRVELKRKPVINAFQNMRQRIEVIPAQDKDEAKRLALKMHGDLFNVVSVREIR